jgi:hypothetical protein
LISTTPSRPLSGNVSIFAFSISDTSGIPPLGPLRAYLDTATIFGKLSERTVEWQFPLTLSLSLMDSWRGYDVDRFSEICPDPALSTWGGVKVRPTFDPPSVVVVERMASELALLSMNGRKLRWLVLLMAAAFAFVLSYRSPFGQAPPARILVGKDSNDIAGVASSGTSTGYDPYFHRVNFTRAIVLSGTNALPHKQ